MPPVRFTAATSPLVAALLLVASRQQCRNPEDDRGMGVSTLPDGLHSVPAIGAGDVVVAGDRIVAAGAGYLRVFEGGRVLAEAAVPWPAPGAFRRGDRDEIMNKVTALSVLSNAVLVWNSVRFAEIVEGLEGTTGDAVQLADLARVSPLASAHVIPSGTYRFPRALAA